MERSKLTIVTDLDGSLLREDKKISLYSRRIFFKCKKMGIKIIFATARPLRLVDVYCDNIKPDALIILNGAKIYLNNKLMMSYDIKNEDLLLVIKYIMDYIDSSNFFIEIDGNMYSRYDNNKESPIALIHSLADLTNKKAEKILITGIHIDAIKRLQLFLPANLHIIIEKANEKMLACHILNKNASKFNGIKFLSEDLNINIENIIAFGDDVCDIEMIEKCGIGIAMDNGIDEVKTVSKYICQSNDKDGIAKWIERNVFQ